MVCKFSLPACNLFILFTWSFTEPKFLILLRSNLSIFLLWIVLLVSRLRSWRFSLFSQKLLFYTLHLSTRPISGHFKVWNVGQGLFCVCPWVSNGSSSFVAKTYLPPLKCFYTFVKSQLGSFVCLCFSDSLFCSSICVYLYHPPIPHCLDYRSYVHVRLMKAYHVLQYTWQDTLLSIAEQKKGAFVPPRWRHFPSQCDLWQDSFNQNHPAAQCLSVGRESWVHQPFATEWSPRSVLPAGVPPHGFDGKMPSSPIANLRAWATFPIG